MNSPQIKRFYLLPIAIPMMLSLSSAANAYSFDVDLDSNPATKETFEIYGKVRLSVDYGYSDLGSAPENKSSGLTDGSIGLSSNTTLFGIRGSYALENDPYTIVWQLETKFNPDTDGGDTLGTRDTFLGIKTPLGLFRAGHMDTPFKVMGIRNSLFVATAADAHAILGKSSISGARLDLRAQNALKWDHTIHGLHISALYSFDGQRGTEGSSDQFIDTNEDDVYSMSLGYRIGPVMLMGAYESWADAFGGSIDAWRTGARYSSGPITVGAIYGDINTDESVVGGSLSRAEYGAYLSYNFTQRTSVAGQWIHADESEIAAGGDDGDQYSIGMFHKLSKPLTLHAVATMTDNGSDGRYGTADFAHGDRIATVNGGSPYVVSIGAEFQF